MCCAVFDRHIEIVLAARCGVMESATGSHLIFVYGTLKQGQPNHDAYTGDRTHGRVASFACSAETEACYPLVIFTQFNIPAILAAEGQGKVGAMW